MCVAQLKFSGQNFTVKIKESVFLCLIFVKLCQNKASLMKIEKCYFFTL